MTPDQKLAMDLIELSADCIWLATALKRHGKTSVSYVDLFRSFAATVDQVAKEVAAS